jgi:hypothetical protein
VFQGGHRICCIIEGIRQFVGWFVLPTRASRTLQDGENINVICPQLNNGHFSIHDLLTLRKPVKEYKRVVSQCITSKCHLLHAVDATPRIPHNLEKVKFTRCFMVKTVAIARLNSPKNGPHVNKNCGPGAKPDRVRFLPPVFRPRFPAKRLTFDQVV